MLSSDDNIVGCMQQHLLPKNRLASGVAKLQLHLGSAAYLENLLAAFLGSQHNPCLSSRLICTHVITVEDSGQSITSLIPGSRI